jgi:hypothetical protein
LCVTGWRTLAHHAEWDEEEGRGAETDAPTLPQHHTQCQLEESSRFGQECVGVCACECGMAGGGGGGLCHLCDKRARQLVPRTHSHKQPGNDKTSNPLTPVHPWRV